MNADVIESLAGLDQLKDEWWELYRRCCRATPFQSPAWVIHWVRHLYRGGPIRTLALREHGELIGLAPLFYWGRELRTVSFLGAGISDYGDLLFAPGREDDCAAAVWAFLARDQRGWDAIDLQEVRGDSGLLAGSRAEACTVCPVLDLSTYPRTMEPKLSTDLHRAQNRLRKQTESSFTVADSARFADCRSAFLALYESRRGTLDAPLRNFHHNVMAEFLEEGLLRLFLLRVGDAPAAAIYSFVSGTTLYCYLSGFDAAVAKLSPGTVLLGHVIEEAMQEGLRHVDFLRDPEAYKYLWGAHDRWNYKVTGHQSMPPGNAPA